MADRLVQQYPGPAGTEHHRQRTGRGRNRLEVDQRLAQSLAGITHGAILAEEVAVVGTSTAAMPAALASTVLLDDHADVETHQRSHVRRQASVGRGHQDTFPDPRHAHRDLLDARVEGTGGDVDTLEQFDFLGSGQDIQRVVRRIELRHILRRECLHPTVLAGSGDRTGRTRGSAKSLEVDRVAVGEAGLFTGLRANANPWSRLKLPSLTMPSSSAQDSEICLEVQVGGVDARPGQVTQDRLKVFDGHATRRQQVFAD